MKPVKPKHFPNFSNELRTFEYLEFFILFSVFLSKLNP